jgi:hypothetical protein
MANEDATLKDVTAGTDAAVVTEPKTDPTPEPKTDNTVNLTADAEAAELGKILLDSGYTKSQISDLLETPNALQSIQFMIRNNPAEFLNMLERTDPNAAKAFHEKMADIYVERYSDKSGGRTASANGSGKETDPQLMQEIAALREETRTLRTEQQQRDNAAQLARLESQYRGRVDELFNKVKEQVPLTRSEERALRAQLDSELATDNVAKKRISNGNFVDVPTKLNTLIRDWSADRKAAAESEKSRREGVKKSAFSELQNGPGINIDIPDNAADSWDLTESAFAKALEQTSR